MTIDQASVTDLAPEFTIGGLGAGETLELDAEQAPVFIGADGDDFTFRFFTKGSKRTGTVTLTLLPGTAAALDEAGDTVPPVSQQALVYDPVTQDATDHTLFIDVRFGSGTVPDAASIADPEDAEFTIANVTDPTATVTVGSPVETAPGLWRYTVTAGAELGDTLQLTFVPGTWTVAGGQSTAVALADSTPDLTNGGYIDVRFNLLGGIELDEETINGDEIEFEGVGADGLTLSSDAPTMLADGQTVRYYFTGAYAAGTVKVKFLPGTWNDVDGNLGAEETERFQLVQSAQPPVEGNPAPRVFFIDISGGMELRLAGAFDNQPIIEIRGKVTLEIGPSPDDADVLRVSLFASGTLKVIALGNIASAAATFVLEKGDGLGDLSFWGVAAFSTNFDFLEQYGIFLKGSALLQVNTTDRVQHEVLSLEGIPGGVIFAKPVAGNNALLSGLPGDQFNPVALPTEWVTAFGGPLDGPRRGQRPG